MRTKWVKAFIYLAAFVAIEAVLRPTLDFADEALAADSCTDGGGSFDYIRSVCDHTTTHAHLAYAQRNAAFVSSSLLVAAVALVVLAVLMMALGRLKATES